MPTTDYSTFTRLKNDYPGVSKQDAAHVLWVMGEPCDWSLQPGGFTEHLIRAAAHADIGNRALLVHGWPGIMRAVEIYKNEPNGVIFLKEVASGL